MYRLRGGTAGAIETFLLIHARHCAFNLTQCALNLDFFRSKEVPNRYNITTRKKFIALDTDALN